MCNFPLTIELVPETCWYSNVRSEVSKPIWDRIRRKAYKEADYKCEICGGVGPEWPVECHEIWQYIGGVQRLIGFQALCPACHNVKHIGRAQIMGTYDDAIEQLMEVNEMSKEEAEDYVTKCFAKWIERSSIKWRLDISYIDKYIDR